MLRKAIFWTHLVIGIAAAIVVLTMSVTGVILTYEMQLNRWAIRDYRAVTDAGSQPLPLNELLERVANQEPEIEPASILIRSDPRDPAALSLGRGNTLYVDRYTGEVLGDGNGAMKRFMRSVMYWHRWFALTGEQRGIGRAVTGAANLGFLFLVLSGFYLWWPSRLNLRTLRQATWFRTGLSGRAKDFNWHNVIGFWSAAPLVIIVFSGATISYRFMGELVYRAVGEQPPSRASAAAPEADALSQAEPMDPKSSPVDYETLVARARSEEPDWKTITLRIPKTSDDGPVTLRVDKGTGRQPSRRVDLVFDRSSQKIIERGGYPTMSRGRKIRSWLRFAHTGEVYGLLGQTIAGIVTAGTVVLVWTGLAMSWSRFFRGRESA